MQRKYKRKYFRIKPENELYSEITIVRLNSRKITAGSAYVRVINISPGGLKFMSGLDFPAETDMVLKFKIELSGYSVSPEGYIIHKSKVNDNNFEYGVCFINVDNSMRYLLVKLFNMVMSQVKNYIIVQRHN
jgi:hypothetical protein